MIEASMIVEVTVENYCGTGCTVRQLFDTMAEALASDLVIVSEEGKSTISFWKSE